MITLTKIDNTAVLVNSDEIEYAEAGHDTTITFKSGKKMIVKESYQAIIERVVLFRQMCVKSEIKLETK